MVARLGWYVDRAIPAHNGPPHKVRAVELQADLRPPERLGRLERRVYRQIPNDRAVTGLLFRLLALGILRALRVERPPCEKQ